MQIVQAVYGVFHHFELAQQLLRRNHLARIYSTWPWARVKREGVPQKFVRTFPPVHTTDYLLRRTRFYSPALDARFNLWNSLSFDRYMRSNIEPCDALIAISGAGLTTGPLVQSRGGKFICDRGSTHQRFQDQVMAEEHRRWGVPYTPPPAHILEREEKIYAAADAITVPSTVARRSFIQMGVAPEKVRVIPYGVRLDRFRPIPRPADFRERFDVLFAGQIGLRKGVPYLLEAFARLRHPRKRLVLARAVPEEFKPVLARLPHENVEVAGDIPQSELAQLMARSHVLVLPSVEEGLALVQGQALASGCPVIATTATGSEDLFSDGVEGFIIADRDTDALASRLQQIADDPDLQHRMSLAALDRVKKLGGWDFFGERWDAFLHEITGIPKDPSEPA